MKENLTTKMYFSSEEALSRTDLHYAAEEQLGILLNDMEVNDLDYGTNINVLGDGTRIEILHSHGQSFIEIIAPQKENPIGKVIYEVRQAGRFFVAIKDPLYDPHIKSEEFPNGRGDSSHFLFWLFENDSLDTLVMNIVATEYVEPVTEEMVSDAKIEAYLELEREGALIGDTITLIPFSFPDIEHYFPKDDPIYGRKMYRTNKRCFREAKSFVNEYTDIEGEKRSTRFVGYCTGALVDSTNEILLSDRGIGDATAERRFQQFHIINDFLVWFGIARTGEPMNTYRDIEVRILKKDKMNPDLKHVGDFTHVDYTGRIHAWNRPRMTTDPGWGNVQTTLVPPMSIGGIIDVDDNGIWLHVPGGIQRAQEWGEYVPYGYSATGSGFHSKLRYNVDGSSPYTWDYVPVMNTHGEVATEFSGMVWGAQCSVKTGSIYATADYSGSPTVDRFDKTETFRIHHTAEGAVMSSAFKSDRSIERSFDGDIEINCDGWKLQNNDSWVVYEGDADLLKDECFMGSCGFSFNRKNIISDMNHNRDLNVIIYYSSKVGHILWFVSSSFKISNGNTSFVCDDVPKPAGIHFDYRTYPVTDDVLPPKQDVCGHAILAGEDIIRTADRHAAPHTCWDTYYTTVEWYAVYVGSAINSAFPASPVKHQEEFLNCGATSDKYSLFCDHTHNIHTPDATWEERQRFMHGSSSGGYSPYAWVVGDDGLSGIGRIGACSGNIRKIQEKLDVDIRDIHVFFDANTTWSKKALLSQNGKIFVQYGHYQPAFAFLDDRACGGCVFAFIGTSEKDDGNNMKVDQWDILLYEDSISNVTAEFFELLGIDDLEDKNEYIVDMGLI